MIIGGIILQIIYNRQNKSSNTLTKEEVVDEDKMNNDDLDTEGIILEEYKKNEEIKQHKNIKIIIFIFAVYFVSQFANTSLNQLGFNSIKFWSLEPIFLYIFSKKILNRIIYKHQKISIISLIICCTTFYLINSFIPDNDGNFIDCKNISNANIYKVICCKLNWYWVPIIILIYLVIMVGNSYSIVSIKWLMDIKYIKLFKILLSLGIFGLIFSLGELFISSYIPCQNKDFFISDINICAIKYKNQSFYDNFRALSNIKVITEFYIIYHFN